MSARLHVTGYGLETGRERAPGGVRDSRGSQGTRRLLDIGARVRGAGDAWAKNPSPVGLGGGLPLLLASPYICQSRWALRLSADHGPRTHLSLDKDAPLGRAIEQPELGRVIPIRAVGGLHHRYIRGAA